MESPGRAADRLRPAPRPRLARDRRPDGNRRSPGSPDVYVDTCDVGRGLFAARAFAPGECILVLRGRRVDRSDPMHLTPAGANLVQTGPRTYILPEPPGLFANHSCSPNAGIVGGRRLVAIRRIARGAEIRFDYSTTMDEEFWSMECRCGARGCRGVVTDFRLLPPTVRTRYLAQGIVPAFVARSLRTNGNGTPHRTPIGGAPLAG